MDLLGGGAMHSLRLLLIDWPQVRNAQMMPNGWGMQDWAYGWGAGHMIFLLIFWIAVIFGVVFVVQNLLGSPGRRTHRSPALDVLSERYAKGEIDREEYLRRRQDIKGV